MNNSFKTILAAYADVGARASVEALSLLGQLLNNDALAEVVSRIAAKYDDVSFTHEEDFGEHSTIFITFERDYDSKVVRNYPYAEDEDIVLRDTLTVTDVYDGEADVHLPQITSKLNLMLKW